MSKAQVDKEVFFRRLKKILGNWEVSPWLLDYLQMVDLNDADLGPLTWSC